MAKSKKISSQDFLDLLDDEADQQTAAFRPLYFQKPETDNKEITNGYQTDNIEALEQIAIEQQTDNKQITKISSKIETDNKQVTKRVTEQITIEQQTDNKRITIVGFEALVGNEKNLLVLVFEECLRIGSLVSPEITLSHISERLEISPGVAKMVIHRLVKKGFIERASSKTGRGGWIKFSITKDLYRDLRIRQTDNKQVTIGYQTDNKQVTKRVTEQITESPCSSSNLNINNTTTTEPDLWLSVPKNLEGRVSIRQLRDFVKQNLLSAEDLQSSLDGFAYDLEKGSIRAKNGNPVAILIGAVKSGGYISQSYLSELKASLADVAKAREEMEQIQAANSTQQLQEEFESFRAKFPDQAEQIKPMSKYLTNFELGSVGYKMWLEEYRKSQSIQPSLEAAEAKP
jgi:predicted transcriptional regulator